MHKNKMIKIKNIILILSFVFIGLSAQASDKMDNLLVYGNNFLFSVKEPTGWKGDIDNAASYRANIVFYHSNENFREAKTMIRILIANKTDENTIEDLKYDMESYRKQYPKIKFKDILIKHPDYGTYPKLFYIDDNFYEYTTYLNPGKRFRYIISVSMNKQKINATKEEIEAYTHIIESLKAMK